MIEAPRHLARQFQVRHLILADRHQGRLVGQDVGALQQRVAQKAVGGQILVPQLFLLILVGGHPFEPAQRRDHRQQQVQFGVFRHPRLHEQHRAARIDAGRQPVDDHVLRVFGDLLRVFVVGGQRVPVGGEEKAAVLVLQAHPVLQHPVVVTQVQAPGRAHAGQDPIVRRGHSVQADPPRPTSVNSISLSRPMAGSSSRPSTPVISSASTIISP